MKPLWDARVADALAALKAQRLTADEQAALEELARRSRNEIDKITNYVKSGSGTRSDAVLSCAGGRQEHSTITEVQ